MKRDKLKKEQTCIIVLSVVIFVFALAKYLISPEHMPVSFYMFEFVSVAGVLALLYYSDHVFRRLHKKLSDKGSEIESLTIDIDHLKKELEARDNNSVKKSGTGIFEDIENLFVNLPPFAEKSKFCNKALSVLGDNLEVITGLFFVYDKQSQDFSVEGNYGIRKDEPVTPFNIGEGLHGEALNEREVIELEEVPEDYFSGYSGLGEAKPRYIYILPVADENRAVGVIELATFKPIPLKENWDKINHKLLDLITE